MARKAKAKARVVPLRRGRPRKQQTEDDGGDERHVRQLAPERAVRSLITEVIAAKNQTSEIGQGLSEATKRASEVGVNVPAARLAARIYSKARMDSAKARVLWEDLVFYLMECTDFDRIAPAGMFTSVEGGQQHLHQEEMHVVGDDEPPAPMAAQAEDDGGEHVTH